MDDREPGPDSRPRDATPSLCHLDCETLRQKKSRSPLSVSFAPFFVKSSLFKTMDHSRYALGAKTNSGKCEMPCVNGVQV